MTVEAKTMEESIRQVVRGERPWTDLRTFGMQLFPDEGRAEDIPPIDVTADLHDLAKGFLSHSKDPRSLKQWAFVMEALPTDFQAEGHPAGEAVLDLLWSTSFGEPIGEEGVRLLKELAKESPSQP
jgi:hypothetical protein